MNRADIFISDYYSYNVLMNHTALFFVFLSQTTYSFFFFYFQYSEWCALECKTISTIKNTYSFMLNINDQNLPNFSDSHDISLLYLNRIFFLMPRKNFSLILSCDVAHYIIYVLFLMGLLNSTFASNFWINLLRSSNIMSCRVKKRNYVFYFDCARKYWKLEFLFDFATMKNERK